MVGQHAFIAVYILASRRNGTLYTRPPTDVPNVRDGWLAGVGIGHRRERPEGPARHRASSEAKYNQVRSSD